MEWLWNSSAFPEKSIFENKGPAFLSPESKLVNFDMNSSDGGAFRRIAADF